MAVDIPEGKLAESIWWLNETGDSAITCPKGGQIVYSSEFFGDHAENWMVVIDANGVEIGRHNTKYIASINWKEDQNA